MGDDHLEIDVDAPSDTTALITLTGDVDSATAPMLREAVATVMFTQHPDELIIDFAAVDFLDSGGIRVLIDVHRQQRDRDGRLILANVPPAPRRVLEITGLTASLDLR